MPRNVRLAVAMTAVLQGALVVTGQYRSSFDAYIHMFFADHYRRAWWELVEPRWYHHLLHNHTAAVLKALLLLRGNPQIVIVSIPWYLRDWLPERRLAARWRKWRRLGAGHA